MNRTLLALALGLTLTACAPRTAPEAPPTTAATAAPVPSGAGGVATPAPAASGLVGAAEPLPDNNPAKVVFPDTERVQLRPLTLEATADSALSKALASLPEEERGRPAFLAETAGGAPLGVAYQSTVELEDQPTEVLVGMGMDGTIQRVVVQNSPEEAVAGAAFLDQFMGKSARDLEDEGLVRPAEGAEDASKEILAAVRRAALILDHGVLDPAKRTAETHGVRQE